jgi:cell division protein FtsB
MAQAAAAARRAPSRRTRTTPPPRRGPIQWHRVGRLALLGTLLVILLLYIAPISHWIQQRSTASNSEADLHALQAEHARLEARLRSLDSIGAVEQQARAMGMVKRGEKEFVIEGAR